MVEEKAYTTGYTDDHAQAGLDTTFPAPRRHFHRSDGTVPADGGDALGDQSLVAAYFVTDRGCA